MRSVRSSRLRISPVTVRLWLRFSTVDGFHAAGA